MKELECHGVPFRERRRIGKLAGLGSVGVGRGTRNSFHARAKFRYRINGLGECRSSMMHLCSYCFMRFGLNRVGERASTDIGCKQDW